MKKVYVIGSLRNPRIPEIGNQIRALGFQVFDDWYAAGEKADDAWQTYEKAIDHTYADALRGLAARHVFEFDQKHLSEADIVVLVMPAGKSGHLELGWALGAGKRGYILFDKEPERWDVMYLFAHGVYFAEQDLLEELKGDAITVSERTFLPICNAHGVVSCPFCFTSASAFTRLIDGY